MALTVGMRPGWTGPRRGDRQFERDLGEETAADAPRRSRRRAHERRRPAQKQGVIDPCSLQSDHIRAAPWAIRALPQSVHLTPGGSAASIWRCSALQPGHAPRGALRGTGCRPCRTSRIVHMQLPATPLVSSACSSGCAQLSGAPREATSRHGVVALGCAFARAPLARVAGSRNRSRAQVGDGGRYSFPHRPNSSWWHCDEVHDQVAW
jgi:hypothetical protein